MYRCLLELSVRYDGQSQRESEHASLIDEHAHLILFAKCVRYTFQAYYISKGLGG